MFFLGRWSGTGLFPLVVDMIADTMDHIRKNKDLLINIKGAGYWHRQDDNVTSWRNVPIEYGPHLKPVEEYLPDRAPTNPVNAPLCNECFLI